MMQNAAIRGIDSPGRRLKGDVPLNPVADAPTIGQTVLVDSGTQQLHGILRWCGGTTFAEGLWAGVELDEPVGKNDGSVMGERYFECRPGHGLFVRLPKVVKAPDSAATVAKSNLAANQVQTWAYAHACRRASSSATAHAARRRGISEERPREAGGAERRMHNKEPVAGTDGASGWRPYLRRARSSVAKAPHDQLPNWTLAEWLNSLTMYNAIADALSKFITDDSPEVQVSFLKKLGQYGSCADVEWMLLEGHILHVLADTIWKGAQKLASASAVSDVSLNQKFQHEADTFGLSYGGISTFFAGLEGLVGSPDPQIETAMRREHCESDDSVEEFITSNYEMRTTSKAEWHFVMHPDGGPQQAGMCELGLEEWPREVRLPNGNTDNCRIARPLAAFFVELETLNAKLDQAKEPRLMDGEVCGLRLYTGPMFMKYNCVLRSFASDSMRAKFDTLCLGNKYTTTLHVINSGIVKSGKLTKATSVYRGLQGGLLPEGFWTPNEQNVRGGVEYAFMSTTLDRRVAVNYASGGAVGTIFEIKMGMVDRGADLSWISQYPHEKEICFAPLTGVEVVSTRVEDSVLVVQVHLNINLSALTIEQVLEKRKKVMKDMCHNLIEELSQEMTGSNWQDLAREVQCAQLPDLVKTEVKGKLKQITDRPCADFNDDQFMQKAMHDALTAVAKARHQRADILEAVANRIEGETAERIRGLAAAYLAEEAVVKNVTVHGGPPYGNMRFVKGSVLDLVGLKLTTNYLELAPVQRYEAMNGHKFDTLLAKWVDLKQLALGWILVMINGSRGKKDHMLEKLTKFYSSGNSNTDMTLTFIRPKTAVESRNLVMRLLLESTKDDSTEGEKRMKRRLLRVLELHGQSRLDLTSRNIGERPGLALAKALQSCSCVKELYLDDNGFEAQAGLAFAKVLETSSILKVLHIYRNRLGETAGLTFAEALKRNSSLQELFMDVNGLGEKSGVAFAKALETNCSVKELFLSSNELGEEAGLAFASALGKNTSLNALSLGQNGLGERAGLALAEALEKNVSISRIYLHSNGFGEKVGLAFAKLLETNSSVERIYLHNNGFGEKAGLAFAKALEVNTSIKTMSLHCNDFRETAGVALAKALETNTSAKGLFFHGNKFGDLAGITLARAVEKNSSLIVLSIGENGFGEKAGLELSKAIEMSNSLHSVTLNDNSFGDNVGINLAKALERNSSVKILYLNGNRLGDEAGVAIAKALEKNSSVYALYLHNNELGEVAGLALAEALKNNDAVKHLHLHINDLGDKAGAALAEAFESNFSVETLFLDRNRLGDNTGLAFAKVLEKNSSIATLFLPDNELGEESGMALAKALETNASIRALSLNGNSLGNRAGLALATALEKNSSVIELYLNRSSLDDEAGLAFANALKKNSSVNILALANNRFGEKASLALRESLETNFSVVELFLSGNKKEIGNALETELRNESSIKDLFLDGCRLGEAADLAVDAALSERKLAERRGPLVHSCSRLH